MLAPKPHVVSSSVSWRRDAVAFPILLFFAALILCAPSSFAQDPPRSSGGEPAAARPELTAEEEIGALIGAIGASECTFIRNGKPGSAADAKAHVERKYKYARDKVESAEDFIEGVASKSSMTGRPYLVECPGEPQQPVRQWLLERLAEIRGP
jgi:hypothetical protein